ncbi:STIP1 y and U box-containing protein 1 [Podospora fimiseda]|uniref:E3 ubiquitin-protein ligase CHIP n=1 Tax=Podospora fimiseda TaxID=252190 RepID=A0AAN7H0L7_9PEZI|nr:STIP1 y and U box-containing protein 1 [Podospora fimiseda]
MTNAIQLKEEGNRRFQAGDYARAEALYSQALVADQTNPALYTNRAMARLKLNHWDDVIADCDQCLRISPDNMKAHYYLSQAHLALHAYDDAVTNAEKAHALCVNAGDKSLAAITGQVLKCKKERWDDQERRRIRETSDLENEVIEMLERERDQALHDLDNDDFDAVTRKEVEEEWEQKINRMRGVFESATANESKRRKVPDWAIDDISFCVMVDPVITKTGKSYERASIEEHLRRQPTDPLTREPLYVSELRPNLGLKQACQEFLEENGWAADW